MRVCNFEMDGVSLKIASMTVREAEEFANETKALIEKQKSGAEVPVAEWLDRRNQTVLCALNKADGEWTVERLKNELDLPTLDALYLKILEFSGLRTGEPPAVI